MYIECLSHFDHLVVEVGGSEVVSLDFVCLSQLCVLSHSLLLLRTGEPRVSLCSLEAETEIVEEGDVGLR